MQLWTVCHFCFSHTHECNISLIYLFFSGLYSRMSSPNKVMRVRIPANGSMMDGVEWITLDDGRVTDHGRCPIAALPHHDNIELVIPAARVAPHQISLPAIAARHEIAVIRQQLTDRVLSGMEDCHFVRGQRQEEIQTIWVTSRKWMLAVCEACRGTDIFPRRALPEQALLPVKSYVITPEGVAYCTAAGECGLLPDEALLGSICEEPLNRMETVLAEPARFTANLLEGLPALGRVAPLPKPLLKAGIALAVIAAACYLLGQFITLRELTLQEDHLRAAIRQNFAAAHPGVPIVDPILQWRQLHGQGKRTGGDVFDQLGELAQSLNTGIHPQRIDIEGSTLRITVVTSDAEQLKPVLQRKGMKFESRTTDRGLQQFIITRPAQGGRS